MSSGEEGAGLAFRGEQGGQAQRCPWTGYACNEVCGLRDEETGRCAFLEIARHLEVILVILRSLDVITLSPTQSLR